jgi:hypothetical protein
MNINGRVKVKTLKAQLRLPFKSLSVQSAAGK